MSVQITCDVCGGEAEKVARIGISFMLPHGWKVVEGEEGETIVCGAECHAEHTGTPAPKEEEPAEE